MIEVEESRTGQPYLVVNSHHLSSSVDPLAEARKWVQVYRERADEADMLFVLGLGSGYHVLELARHYPETPIRVFEGQAEVISAVLKLHVFPGNVEILAIAPTFDDIDMEWLKMKSVILRYAPSIQLQPTLYRELILFLTGRHPNFVSVYKEIVPTYANLTNLEGPIGIYDFAASCNGQAELLSHEDRIWLLLRELVK